MYETAEIGPVVGGSAPDFTLLDQDRHSRTLQAMLGDKGLLIGFINDIWKPASIRRILFLQRHVHKFTALGINLALIIVDQQHTLYSFYMSSPMTVGMPMLADADGDVHEKYNVHHPALVMIDADGIVRAKWLMPDERVWPRVQDLLSTVRSI